MLILAQAAATATTLSDKQALTDACGDDPGLICEWTYDLTGSDFLAKAAQWLSGAPFRIIIILLGALIIGIVFRRIIRVFAAKLTDNTTLKQAKGARRQSARRYRAMLGEQNTRANARTKTIGSVLSSVAFALIWIIAFIMILGELDINIGPLLAGAGVAGFALGFGAQTIVRDFLSGVFMLIEDQFGVGDIIDAGFASGTVEKVSLRTTTIRDVTGIVWHIPNGEIHRVANKSQLWSRALLDVEVAYTTDLRLAEGVIQKVADDMWDDKEWGGDEIMEKPEVWGIQNLGADGISIRLVVKTEPATQWAVERELRLRIKEALENAGIEIPFPQRTVWIRNEGEHPQTPKPDPESIAVAPISRYLINPQVEFGNELEEGELDSKSGSDGDGGGDGD